MYNVSFSSNPQTAALYSNVTNTNTKRNNTASVQTLPSQNSKNNSPDNTGFFTKAKKWLFDPIDNPKYEYGVNQPKKIRRADKYFGYLFLALLWGWLLFTMYKDNKSISKGINETQRTLENMNNKSQKLSEFISEYKEDISKSPKLKDLSLPDVLKDTIDRLMNRIKNPEAFIQKGGVSNNAILLYGPPGTGKTTVAKAITKEIENAELFSIDLSTIQDSLHSQSEKNIDKAIRSACQYAKMNPDKKIVLLMDEFDSVAIKDNGSSNQQLHASVLNTLKRAISEKLAQHDNIILIATTNAELEKTPGSGWVQILDSAIADRFGERIRVDRPTAEQFAKAIANHYRGLSKVEDALKEETGSEVMDIAKQLADNKHSFRTLNTLFKNAAETEGEKLTVQDVIQTLAKLISKTESDTQKTAEKGDKLYSSSQLLEAFQDLLGSSGEKTPVPPRRIIGF